MLVIKIVNDGTGTDNSSNYRYQVLINQSVIYSGSVKKHDRNNGWVGLLKLMLEQLESEPK